MRLLHRWADAQLRRDLDRAIYARDQARRVVRTLRYQLQVSHDEVEELARENAVLRRQLDEYDAQQQGEHR